MGRALVPRRAALLTGAVTALVLNTTRAQAGALVVHSSTETLGQFCLEEEGKLWFVLPTGARFELITSTSDPAIGNPGDGQFHPFDESEVARALEEIRYPLGAIHLDVYVLPFPRRDAPQSAAGPGMILLAPGVYPLPREVQRAVVSHELGHVVQYAQMPDSDLEAWAKYRSLRGITDVTTFCAGAEHANRPHEIFAEDFRFLFGGSLANYSGTIENASLTPPSQVAGLGAFMLSLSGEPLLAGSLRAYPNPSRSDVRFDWLGNEPVPIEIFDATGRKVRTLQPTTLRTGWSAAWDGRDESGSELPSAVWFARVRGSLMAPIRVALVQ